MSIARKKSSIVVRWRKSSQAGFHIQQTCPTLLPPPPPPRPPPRPPPSPSPSPPTMLPPPLARLPLRLAPRPLHGVALSDDASVATTSANAAAAANNEASSVANAGSPRNYCLHAHDMRLTAISSFESSSLSPCTGNSRRSRLWLLPAQVNTIHCFTNVFKSLRISPRRRRRYCLRNCCTVSLCVNVLPS